MPHAEMSAPQKSLPVASSHENLLWANILSKQKIHKFIDVRLDKKLNVYQRTAAGLAILFGIFLNTTPLLSRVWEILVHSLLRYL